MSDDGHVYNYIRSYIQ